MSEPALPLPGLAETTLTARQRQALAIVRGYGPMTSEELGARLREVRGGRESGAQWDTSNGRALAESLRAKGLVRQVRLEGRMAWVEGEWAPGPEVSSQMSELPEWL